MLNFTVNDHFGALGTILLCIVLNFYSCWNFVMLQCAEFINLSLKCLQMFLSFLIHFLSWFTSLIFELDQLQLPPCILWTLDQSSRHSLLLHSLLSTTKESYKHYVDKYLFKFRTSFLVSPHLCFHFLSVLLFDPARNSSWKLFQLFSICTQVSSLRFLIFYWIAFHFGVASSSVSFLYHTCLSLLSHKRCSLFLVHYT